MTTTTYKTTLALSLTLLLGIATQASAKPNQKLFIAPPHHNHNQGLPKFGFYSYTVHGVGEQVTGVRWGSLAQQIGLESGDMILALNGFPLTYHGAWNDALSQAMATGGWVQLSIRDVRTGWVVQRTAFVGYGPGNPHIVSYQYSSPNFQGGPSYYKSQQSPNNTVQNVIELVEAFKSKKP